MRILVVDDSRISRRALMRVLRGQADLTIEEAPNGKVAVEAYARDPFDLVFMDLTMPIMSGYEACEAITRADPEARVAIVSADIQPIARQRCQEAGAIAFVGKPIGRGQVFQLVAEARAKIAC